ERPERLRHALLPRRLGLRLVLALVPLALLLPALDTADHHEPPRRHHRQHLRGPDHRVRRRLPRRELVLVEPRDPALRHRLPQRRDDAVDVPALLAHDEVHGPERAGARLLEGLLGGHDPGHRAIRSVRQGAAAPGTLEHFLVERYILFADTG